MSEEQKIYSIALRLRRVTYEDAYVSVPVTEVTKRNEDGTNRIDGEALVAAGVALGQDARVQWRAEESTITPHPTQVTRPDDRESFSPGAAPNA
jgi:hypothetical protein